jgi:hypothetical protein
MKKLELNQMENLEGGATQSNGFLTGMACGFTIVAAGAFIYGTAGVGAAIGANAAAAVCGGLIGWGSASGSWF